MQSTNRARPGPLRQRWALLGLLAGLTGCLDRDPRFEQEMPQPATLELGGRLLIVNPARDRVEVVSAKASEVETSRLPFESEPDLTEVATDGSRAALHDVETRTLTVLEAAATRDYLLPAEFTGLSLSEDGKFAVLFHAAGKSVTSLVNTDQIALVDLTKPAEKDVNPRLATIAGLARAPLAVRIGPEMDTADGKHRLVWAEAPSVLGVADFGPGQPRTAIVPLAADPKADVRPVRTVARAEGSRTDLYLLSSGLNDVVHVRVDLAGPDLEVSLDQIASGNGPADLVVFLAKEGLRIAAVNKGSRDLALLDPATGTGLTIPLAHPAVKFRSYMGADGLQHALLLSDQAVPYLYVVDLEDLAKRKGKAVHLVQLDHPVAQVVQAGSRFVIGPGGGVQGLTVLDPATQVRTAFAGAGTVLDLRATPDRVYALGKVGDGLRLSRIEMTSLQGTSLGLARTPTRLARLGDSGIAVLGAGMGGWWIAAFPTGELTTDAGRWLEGLTLQGLLEVPK